MTTSSLPPARWFARVTRDARHAGPDARLRRVLRRVAALGLAAVVLALAVPAVVHAGTPGSDPANGSWVGGEVLLPGPAPLVLWNLPGTAGARGTCIDANADGPLHGPYSPSSTITDPVYGELNHLFANAATTNVRLAELSAINSRRFDYVDRGLQWSYLVNRQGATSVADANAMLTQAINLAGPYNVAITWPAGDTAVGVPYRATVTVTSANGTRVPGSLVALGATGARLDAASATTDRNGQATIGFTIAAGTSATFSIAATVPAWTQVTVFTAHGEQRMLSAAAPVPPSGSSTGPVERTREVELVKVGAGDPTLTPVPGYVYRITDAAGAVVAESVTTGATATAADLGQLAIGATYTATEIGRPEGGALYIPIDASSRFTVPAGAGPWTIVAHDPRIPSPTITTQALPARAVLGQRLTDTVRVGGNDAENGSVTATLYGPVPPPPSGRCSDLSLAAYLAAPARRYAASVTGSERGGDGDVLVTGPAASEPGCYGWGQVLTLSPSQATVMSGPTAPSETSLVTAPTVRTTASAQVVVPGTALTDTVVVTGLDGQGATLVARLYGPLPVQSERGCSAVTDQMWRSAIAALGPQLLVGTDTVHVDGDGLTLTTPLRASAPGCYTYAEELTPQVTPAMTVHTPYGVPTESTLVAAAQIVTSASVSRGPASTAVTDQVTVAGTGGLAGEVTGRLLGPVAPRSGSCARVSWAGAPVAAAIPVLSIAGDGMYTTLPVHVSRAGCYTFAERLTLAESTQSALDTTAGVPVETVLITGAGPAGGIAAPWRPASTAPRPSAPATGTLAQTGPRAPIVSALLIGFGLVCLGTVLATTPRRRPNR